MYFKIKSAGKNSNKFQKTRFWKEISVEDVITLGPMAQAPLVLVHIHINTLSSITLIYICQKERTLGKT
jgi:hypothetical protein